MLGGRGERLNADDALQYSGCLRVLGGRGDDTRAVDEVDTLGQCDILPDLLVQFVRLASTHAVKGSLTLVSPGTGATLQTFPLLSVLMTLLFPTLG